MEVRDWPGMLGAWSQGDGPLYKLLAAALQKGILSGDIGAGSRLPAERKLAQQLAVSRTTVVAAYDLLREDGWVERRIGSGTWVQPVTGEHAMQRHDQFSGSLARNPFFNTLLEPKQVVVDLTKANVAIAKSLPPSAFSLTEHELTQLLNEHSGGYAPLGLPALRQVISDRYTTEGLPTSPEQILVTSGAQQAIYLVASLYVQRGDNVLIENPTYAGAIDAFRAAGGRLISVPVEEEGLRVGLLEDLAKASLPQVIYVTPTCHNPTGSILREEGRRRIAEVSGEYSIPVLEDNTLADLAFGSRIPASIATYSDKALVITVDSVSKLFWAGLRVGWLRAPASIVARLARLKAIADLGSSLVSQAIAARLIGRNDEVRALRRQDLLDGLDYAVNLLRDELPGWSWTPPMGGPYLWVRLPCCDSQELSQVALRHGVLITPGASMSVDGSHTSYLRLPFSLDRELLTEGIRRLAGAWEAFTRLPGIDRQLVNVVV